jgi:hypothetical protein
MTVHQPEVHAFGEKSKKSNFKNSQLIQIIHILVHWNPLKNGDKTHGFFCHPNNNNNYGLLNVSLVAFMAFGAVDLEKSVQLTLDYIAFSAKI